MTREQWRPIDDAPHYEVSDRGRVRRVWKNGPKILKAAPNDCGYFKVSLGRARQAYVHRLVCAAFNGPAPTDEHTVDHLDFNTRNNRADNLRWLTLQENACRHHPAELDAWWGRQRHRKRRSGLKVAA